MRALGLGVLLLAAAVAAWTWWWLRSSLPELSGTVRVSGPSSAVTIARDRRGIPTITAGSTADALFGLGYAHAQDRFFQLELQRRAGQGRLAELAGPAMLEADVLMRTLGLYRAAGADEAALLPESRSALAAYSAGVNAWLESHRERLPPEFGLLRLNGRRIVPEPWRPADTLVWAKMMALSLSGNFREELLRADLVEKLGAERASELFPPYPAEAPVIVGQLARTSEPAPRRGPDTSGSLVVGSNSWVIGPARSVSGHALLANDPHLGIQSPATWYIARLDAPDLHAVGMTLPGIPAIVIGRNERCAWGVTNLAADTQDLFLERVDPKDPGRYLVGDRSEPFTLRTETILVAGRKDPVVITVRATRHGPVVREDGKGRGPLALRWTALDPDDTTLDAMLGVQRARSFSDFTGALARAVAPALSMVYADVDGHIGYLAVGRLPIRARADGALPQEGWPSDAGWSGFIPADKMPSAFDPAEGFIVTANNRPVGERYPFVVGGSFGDGYRARRIRELVLAQPKLALADVVKMQSDVTSLLARDLAPILREVPETPARREALELVRRWDGVEAPESAAGAIFIAWYAHLLPALLEDELGTELLAAFQPGGRHVALRHLLTDPSGRWCDDQRTPERESCAVIAGHALDQALEELRARLGPDAARWRLDALLVASFENRVGSRAPLLGRLFTRTARLGGDPSTVRVTHLSLKHRYEVTSLSSCFVDVELAAGAPARMVLPLGQSGHPRSPFFDDQLSSWLRTEPPPLADAAGEDAYRLTVEPAPAR